MKKSDLKNSMIVKIRKGEFGLVFKNKILFLNNFIYLKDFTEDLKVESKRVELDIIKVYKPRTIFCLGDLINIKEIDLDLIWEREKRVDWTKVQFGTEVIVSDRTIDLDEYNGIIMKFVSYEPRLREYPFIVTDSINDSVSSFKYCRIHPDVEIKEEWCK